MGLKNHEMEQIQTTNQVNRHFNCIVTAKLTSLVNFFGNISNLKHFCFGKGYLSERMDSRNMGQNTAFGRWRHRVAVSHMRFPP